MKMEGEMQHCKDRSLCWHENNCISSKQVNCDICKEQFHDRELLANHILTHIGAAPYCSICKAVFITPWQLHNHLMIYHKVSSKIELLCGNPQCDDCILHHGTELAFHYAHHIKQMPYTCELCNLSFCNQNDFIIHSHLHKPDDKMNCDVCKKTFKEKLKCLFHVVRHNNHVLFQHFPNCALKFSNSLSPIRNTENILNSSDNNLLGIDSECQDHLCSVEFIDERCSDNSSQFEGYCNEDVGQFQKTDMCNMEDFDENDKNQRFPSVGNFTWRQSKVSVKELWVILHKLPDCIYNTYSCNNSIYVDNLKFGKTRNCCTFDMTSGKSCAVSDFPHVCGNEKDLLSTLNQEKDISDQNLNMVEYSVFSTDFDLSDNPDSVLADLLSEESSIFLQPCSDEVFYDYRFKITKAVKVKVYIPKSLWSCDPPKKFSSLLKEYDLYVLNDGLKFVSLHICETAEPSTKPHKLVCIKGKTGLKFLIPDCSKKPCVKLYRLCDNILNLYMNNHPVILKKDIVQETLNNTDQLGDCSGVIEFNLDLHAHVVDNSNLESDNFVIEDDHENYESVQSCESNTDIFHHDQVKLRDLFVKVHRLSDDTVTSHLKSVLSAEGENDNFINLCVKNNDRDDQQKSVDKEKIKSYAKKSEKKKTVCEGISKNDNFINLCVKNNDRDDQQKSVDKEKIKSYAKKSEKKKTVCEGISNKPQKNKVYKKMLGKKCVLLEKYMKSLLLSHCMKNFLLNFKYAELADAVKKLRNRSKKNHINEEFVSFVGRLINSVHCSKKNVKGKKSTSSRFIPEKNFQRCMPKIDEIMCFSPEFNNSFNVQGVQEMRSMPKIDEMCFSPEFKSFNVQGVQEMKENTSTSKTIFARNPSDSSVIQHEIADISEEREINNSIDHCSTGCSTTVEEIQNNGTKKVENKLGAKKVLHDSIPIRSETGDLEEVHNKEHITHNSYLNKVSECRAKSFNVQGVQEMKENASTSKTISARNSSDSSVIRNEIADISEVHEINNSIDHCSTGCSTNMKEIQNNAEKSVENKLGAKKVLDDSIHIRSETGDLKLHNKECVTHNSYLKKVSECRAMINLVRAALKRRQSKFPKKVIKKKTVTKLCK